MTICQKKKNWLLVHLIYKSTPKISAQDFRAERINKYITYKTYVTKIILTKSEN